MGDVDVTGAGAFSFAGEGNVWVRPTATGSGSFSFAGDGEIHVRPVVTGSGSFSFAAAGTISREAIASEVAARPKRIIYRCYVQDLPSLATIEVPFSSIQMRLRNGDPAYISVVVPNYTTYWSDIYARQAGTLTVKKGYYFLDDQTEFLVEIKTVNIDSLSYDLGGEKQSISLSGHVTETYTNPQSWTVWTATKSMGANGKMRIRTGLEFNLDDTYIFYRPGDSITSGVDTITVGLITINARPGGETVDITEA